MIEGKCRGGKGEKPESGEEKWSEGGQREREKHRAREGGRQETLSLSFSLSLTHTHTHTHSLSLSHTHTHTHTLPYTFAPAVLLSVLECKHCREESDSPPLSTAKE